MPAPLFLKAIQFLMVCLSSVSFYSIHRETNFATNFSSVCPWWCNDLTSLFTPYLHQIWICHCFLDNKNIICLAVITYIKSLPYVYYIPVSYSLDRAWVNSFGSSFDMMAVITEKASINNWSEHSVNTLSEPLAVFGWYRCRTAWQFAH